MRVDVRLLPPDFVVASVFIFAEVLGVALGVGLGVAFGVSIVTWGFPLLSVTFFSDKGLDLEGADRVGLLFPFEAK